ncbi:MAG: ROK family protein [Ignavibacteriae bacterium]|nr:ROK family protein [Ignavibacteriota bacterium]
MAIKNVITVDLGGTKILTALLNNKTEIVSKYKLPTKYDSGAENLVKSIAKTINAVLTNSKIDQKKISAISLGVPGTVNPNSGIIGNAPNLSIVNFNIKEALQKYFSIPVIIENDVNLAALGIKKYEFKDKVNNMLVVFVGTGIGGALIFNGKMYRGSSFFAGEIGHMKVSKKGRLGATNNSDTFEGIASRTAIVNSITAKIKKGEKSELAEMVKSGEPIKSKSIAKALKNGDELVIKNVESASKTIGTVLGSITTLLNLDTIVLGGGVVEAAGDFMLPVVETAFYKTVLNEPGKAVNLKITKLGDYAPIYGGAALAEEFIL